MSGTLEKSIISPAEASGLVQEAYDTVTASLPMAQVLPDKSNGGDLLVEWAPNFVLDQDDAEFRAWDAEAGYGRTRGGGQTKHTELIAMSRKLRVTEKDIIRFGASTDAIRSRLEENLVQLGKEVAWRTERARLDVALNAKLSVDENNIKGVYDFERDASLDVTPAVAWDKAEATPIKDIRAWVDAVKALRGMVPKAVVTTSDVLNALSQNPSIIMIATGHSKANIPDMIGIDQVKAVLQSFTGIGQFLLADEVYQESNVKYSTTFDSKFPATSFLMLPQLGTTAVGFTASGPTVEAGDAEYAVGKAENSGWVGAVFSTATPPAYEAYVNGSVLPVLTQANSTVRASVLTKV